MVLAGACSKGVHGPGSVCMVLGGGIPACTEGDPPPLWTEWQTGVKISPCPKLRLRAVTREINWSFWQRSDYFWHRKPHLTSWRHLFRQTYCRDVLLKKYPNFFSGVLYDATGSYTLPFIMAATAFTTSGILCLPMRKLVRWEVRQKNPLRACCGCEAAETDHTMSQEIDPASMSALSSDGEWRDSGTRWAGILWRHISYSMTSNTNWCRHLAVTISASRNVHRAKYDVMYLK